MQAYTAHEDSPCLEFLRAVERRSPTLAGAHLLAGIAWCVCLPFSAGLEAAAFAVLTVAAFIRIPATWSVYPRLFTSPVLACYVALQAWQTCSNFWAVAPVESWTDALFSRRLVVLLALWPLAARWRVLLVALCSGALIGAVGALVAVVWHGRLALEASDLLIARHRSNAAPLAAAGMVCAVAYMFWTRSWAAWWGCLAAMALFALQMSALAGRSPAIAAAIGICLVLLMGPTRPGAIRRRTTFVALAVCAIPAAVLLSGPLITRFSQVAAPIIEPSDPARPNVRLALWEVAWERGFDRPIIGHGVNSWRDSIGAEIAASPDRFEVGPGQARRLSLGAHPHNTVLGAWYSTGAIGVLLLLSTVATGVWVLCRAARLGWASAAVLGIAGIYIAVGMFDDLGYVSVGSLMVTLLVLFAAVNAQLLAEARSRRSLLQTRAAPR